MSQLQRFDLLTQPLASYQGHNETLDDVLIRLRELFPANTVNTHMPLNTSPTPSSDVHSRSPSTSPNGSPNHVESDLVRLKWRQRQIDYGKNTLGYQRYRTEVPVNQRLSHHPKTPPLDLKISKKKWGYMCNNWRRELHQWDPSPGSDYKDMY
ncbi:hypothetical protein GEMRC1_001742 [Eukaryota sp. GEM-RC1]